MTAAQTMPRSDRGSARDALERVTQKLALLLRSLWAVYAIGMITTAATEGSGSRLATAVAICAVLIWAVALALSFRRASRLRPMAASLDVACGIGLLLLGPTLLPRSLLGDGSTWVVSGGSLSALTAIWILSGPLAFGSAVLVGTSYLIGIYLTGGSIANANQLQTIAYLVFTWVVVAILMQLVRQSADHVDATLHDLGIAEQTFRAERERLDHREARDRVFHDHVLAILGLIGSNGLVGHVATLQNQCRRALTRMRELDSGRKPHSDARLSSRFAEVIEEIRDLGLTVNTTLDVVQADEDVPSTISAEAVEAMAEALRQSLLNVLRHAKATMTNVAVSYAPGELIIVVEDNGQGFNPADIRMDAHGIRNSIEARMRDIDGFASIRSAPGTGCAVRLTCPREMRSTDSTAPEIAKVSSGLVRQAFDVGMARAIALVALGWHLLSLSFLLTHTHGYVSISAVIVVWLVMLVAEVVLVTSRQKAVINRAVPYCVATVITAGAIAVLFLCKTRGILGYENWGLGDAGFLLAYLVTYRKLQVAIIGVAAVALANLVVVAMTSTGLEMGSSADSLAKVIGVVLGSGVMQAGEVVVYRMLRANAETVGRAREEIDRAVAMRSAAERISEDRASIYSRTDELVKPILQELADGTADPDSPQVRRRCRLAESALRRNYVAVSDSRMGRELLAFSESAADLGVSVDLRYPADLLSASTAIRRSISAYLIEILAYSRPGRATVTVVPDCDLVDMGETSDFDQERAYGVSTLSLYMPVDATRTSQLARFLAKASSEQQEGLKVGYEVNIIEETSSDGGPFAWMALSGKL